MGKSVVICLDGTNNEVRGQANTNVVRLYNMLDLSDAGAQVAYYAPGVGTFSSPAAWSPLARTASRLAGLAFGAGLRHELGAAYTYLMSAYEEGDRISILGFSRGAYTARALIGLLDVVGLFRPGAENLVPYAVAEYTKRGRTEDWAALRNYSQSFARVMSDHSTTVPIHFAGFWDTVKAVGRPWRPITWPYTRQLPHVATVKHAISIDEKRRPYAAYPVLPLATPQNPPQRIEQVWFAGVHSDVGGMFRDGARLSDIPLKWMAQHVKAAGAVMAAPPFAEAMSQVTLDDATGAPHRMSPVWLLVGVRHRVVPPDALVHASVQRRIAADPGYADHIPATVTYVDESWLDSDR